MEKYIGGIRVYKVFNGWECNYKDYIQAMKEQGKDWNEEQFCNWCDDHDLFAVG